MKTDYTVDTVGKFCPVPMIEAVNIIKEMNKGETLTIVSDDPEIKNDMRKWCKFTGNDFLGESEKNNEIEIYIGKITD